MCLTTRSAGILIDLVPPTEYVQVQQIFICELMFIRIAFGS